MKKKLLTLALISMASTNAFSIDIVKGKLIDHKEGTTGRVKAIFKEDHSNRNERLLSLGKPNKENTNFIYSHVRLLPVEINPIGSSTSIQSSIGASISTNKSEVYTIHRSICVQKKPFDDTQVQSFDDYDCNTYEDKVSMQPGGYVYTRENAGVIRTFDLPGKYDVYSSVFISDANESTVFSTSDYDEITVPAAQKKS